MKRSRVEDVLPLSPLQEGLLFQTLLDDEGEDLYVSQLLLDIEGPLDVARLRLAAKALLRRHANLRAGFEHEGLATPVQVIPRKFTVPWQQVDLAALEPAAQQAELVARHAADRATRFDLANPPLVRFAVFRLAPGRFRLALSKHHLLLDGWSMPIVVRELFELYGDEHGLPPVTPYKDYLEWIARQDKAVANEAWREAMVGLDEPTLLLPNDPGAAPGRPDTLIRVLPVELSEQVQQCAREHDLTVNTLFQGVWGLLLGVLTGRSDVVFGTTVAGRPPEVTGIESMVGLFINTLPIRVRWGQDEPVLDVLRRLQGGQADLMPHQYVSLAEVQQMAGYQRLFDTVTVFQNYPVESDEDAATISGLRISGVPGKDGTHYPISCAAGVAGRELQLRLSYRTDVFDAAWVESTMDRLVRLLAAVVADPSQAVARLDALSADERALVLRDWNDSAADIPTATIAELFQAQAARTPDAQVLVMGEESLTYRELNARANRLAHLLIGRGVGPEDIVAVAGVRSVDQVVSLLAVGKAGAAYLPVDIDYPLDRIAYMVEDARPVLALVDTAADPVVAGVSETPRFVVEGADLTGRPDTDPTDGDRVAPLVPAHPAYVIYTSGSTGRPKGVVVTHTGVASVVHTQTSRLGVGPGTRTLQFASPSFDAAFWEYAMGLLSGGTLVMAAPDRMMPGEPLAAVLREHAITHATLPPVALVNTAADDDLVPEVLVTAGEACSPELVARWSTGRTMINGYGPTETTVAATISGPLSVGGTPPIGTPVVNLRCYVLDAALRPVPAGVAGELYVAGHGLARGYLGRAALTSQRFVANPFEPGGAHMYRTGDVVRWNAAGRLEFVGRADEQVKIRGFRIELGEIESVLAADPSVAQVHVIAREDRPGDRRLVGYLVATPGADVDPAALRARVAETLPEYMVPAAIVVLDAIPVTPNGKVDRKALPAPDLSGAGRAPSTPDEEALCALFAEVLGLDEVGVDQSFFDLGGHSLLATRLVSRIRSALGVELAIRALFEAPSVAALATRLDRGHGARTALVARERPDVVPLSFAQRRLWFLNRMGGQGHAYVMPVALSLTGDLDRGALRAALSDVVGRHESLRTVFPEGDDGTPRQVVLAAHEVELSIAEVPRAAVEDAIAAAAGAGFDLTTEPPLRAHLFHVGEQEHVLALVLHHIAADGWSMAPLARDLSDAYRARVSGGTPQWAPLAVQYADYTLWHNELLGREDDADSVIASQLRHWSTALAGLPDQLDLPTDRPRPATPDHRGGRVPVWLDGRTHARLADLARESGASPFMVLQAAFATLLTRLGAGTDIPIGTPVAGRTDDALDDLVGFFVNTLVLRTDTSGDPTFRELVGRARDTGLAAYANQDVPFERLVEVLNPRRSLARHPLFQVMLTLQNTGEATIELPGLRASGYPVPGGGAKFDLSLSLAERHTADGLPDGVDGMLAYRADLFEEGTAQRVAGWFERVLAAAVAEPDLPIGALDLLDPAQRHDALVRWNSAEHDVPIVPITELIEAQVARTPEALALTGGGVTLRYRELDERANALAHLLIARGAGPGDIVAVALPRSVDLVVALLAVLKSGAAYLPVDLDHPADRIRYVLDDARPALLIGGGAFADLPVVSLDDPRLRDQPVTAPTDADRRAALRPAHPAYVIYTSGSTGRPKGVVVEHRSVADYLGWTSSAYPSATGAALLHSPVAFDLTVTALYTPLVVGGCVHVAALEESADTSAALEVEASTFLKATPSHLPLLTALPDEYSPLGELLLGGEALLGEAVAAWRDLHPHADVVNVYGPTEATVNCTQYRVPAGAALPPGPVPIGKPFAGTRAYVLDARLQPVPTGVPGELYIAGASLARGYLGRAALTSERFTADPYGPAGSRMYRTGDVARRLPNGDLVYLGRADDQVKVRGHRIEPGEIESVLRGLDGVAEAAVVVREDRPGDRRLVAYVVGDANRDDDLRDALAQRLPEYMVPAAFVALPALPLTRNGKLDRAALPAPDFAERVRGRAPRTPVERVLCELFGEVLGVDGVGVDDDFFELGGHSLLIIRLVGLIHDRLGARLGVAALFQSPTVARLAPAVEGGTTRSDGFESLIPLRAKGSLPPLFCVHPALGIGWVYSGLLRSLPADQPVYALQARGLADDGELPYSVADMADDYLRQVRAVAPHGPYRLVGWSFGGLVAHELATRLQRAGEDVDLTLMDAYPDAPRAERDRDEFLRGLLTAAGVDPAGHDLTHEAVAAALGRTSSAFGALDADRLAGVARVAANNARLAAGFTPGVYVGDVRFFQATAGRGPTAPEVSAWQSAVDGRIDVHPIDCTHDEMTQPQPLARIAEVLTGRTQRHTADLSER